MLADVESSSLLTALDKRFAPYRFYGFRAFGSATCEFYDADRRFSVASISDQDMMQRRGLRYGQVVQEALEKVFAAAEIYVDLVDAFEGRRPVVWS